MIDIGTALTSWMPTVQGQYINEDGAFGAQCWDLAANWSRFLGLPKISTGGPGRWPGWAGNMVDSFPQSPAIDAAYELHGPAEPARAGDIAVWGDTYWYYPKTHVAVVLRDGGLLTCMSQNSTPSRADNPYPQDTTGPTTLQSLPKQGLIGYIRPRAGITVQGNITTTSEEDDFMSTPEDRLALIQELMTHPVMQADGVVTNLQAVIAENRGQHSDVIRVVGNVPGATLNAPIPRGGGQPGTTSLAAVTGWHDAHVVAVIDAVSKATGADVSVIKQAIADGLKQGIHVDVTVNGAH